MTTLKPPTSLTIAEYLAGEELSGVKHEYLGGTVHAMAGASNQHNAIAVNALGFLLAKLRGKSCRPFNGRVSGFSRSDVRQSSRAMPVSLLRWRVCGGMTLLPKI